MEDFEKVHPETISHQEWASLALFRSRVYGFLGAIYNRLPDDRFAENLSSLEMRTFLSSLGEMVELPEDMRAGLKLIEDFIQASRDRPVDELRTELAVERTRLLRGVKPGYSPPPPYESIYIGTDSVPQMQASAAVSQIYAQAGVVLPEEVRDQPDFIGFELDFMRHLCQKEADVWAAGDREDALSVLERERSFLDEHITCWIPHFCDVMFQQSRLDFYRGIASLTRGFVIDEAEKAKELLEWAQIAVEV